MKRIIPVIKYDVTRTPYMHSNGADGISAQGSRTFPQGDRSPKRFGKALPCVSPTPALSLGKAVPALHQTVPSTAYGEHQLGAKGAHRCFVADCVLGVVKEC